MSSILYQSQIDARLSGTYKGYNNTIEDTFSSEGISLQKTLLYLFLYLYILIS